MSPIITHMDELELAKQEKELASKLKKLAKWQRSTKSAQIKLAETLTKMNIARQELNQAYRDVYKQLQTLARENRSNVGDEEVNLFQQIIHDNDNYIENTNLYTNAIKDLAIRKEDLAVRKELLADAIVQVASKRSTVTKKGLSLEKTKNKLIEGSKLTQLENELNDSQREIDRARNLLLKEIEQFLQVRDELNELWVHLKDSVSKMS